MFGGYDLSGVFFTNCSNLGGLLLSLKFALDKPERPASVHNGVEDFRH